MAKCKQVLLFMVACFGLLIKSGVVYSDESQSIISDYPFSLFTQIDDSQSNVSVSVSYVDFQGGVRKDGQLNVPQEFVGSIKKLFSQLMLNGFQLQNVTPLSNYSSVYDALKDNASFALSTKTGDFYLVINPVENPLMVRDSKDGSSGRIAVFPARGILAVNRNHTVNRGKLDEDALAVFLENQFNQALQPNTDKELFFGLLAYQAKGAVSDADLGITGEDVGKESNAQFAFDFGPLPDKVKQSLIASGTWKSGCPVPLDRLSYVRFGYYDYTGSAQQGDLVAADVVAPEVLAIFEHFYKNKVPVEKTGGGDPSGGGTGMFNCRAITGGGGYSLHSYGTALDLSYYRNPYIGEYVPSVDLKAATASLIPNASPLIFLARNHKTKGFNEQYADFIKSKGLSEWGGEWLNRTDYMHFQVSPFFSYLFPVIDYESGRKLFALEVSDDEVLHKFSLENTEVAKWQLLAKLYPEDFADMFVENIAQFGALGENGFYTLLLEHAQALQGN